MTGVAPLAAVVTLIAALCGEVANESVAATVKFWVVWAASPVTVKVVLPAVPIAVPFLKIV